MTRKFSLLIRRDIDSKDILVEDLKEVLNKSICHQLEDGQDKPKKKFERIATTMKKGAIWQKITGQRKSPQRIILLR